MDDTELRFFFFLNYINLSSHSGLLLPKERITNEKKTQKGFRECLTNYSRFSSSSLDDVSI